MAGLLVAAIGLVSVLYIAAREQNERALEAEAVVARSVIDEMVRGFAHSLVAAASWPDAYLHLGEPLDLDWIDKNLGTDANLNQEITGTFIFNDNGESIYAMYEGTELPFDNVSGEAPIRALARQTAILTPTRARPYLSGFIDRHGQLHAVAARVIAPIGQVGTDRELVHVLVYEWTLVSDTLKETAARFGVENLHFDDGPVQGKSNIELINPSGGTAGWLAWTAVRPGDKILRRLIPAAVLTFGLLAFFNAWVLSNWLTLQRNLHQSQTAAAKAQQANRTKDFLIAHLSHEFRTPLNSIIGFSELISSRFIVTTADAVTRHADYASEIAKSGRHLLHMINGILELARIETGERSLDLAIVDLNDIVVPIATDFRRHSAAGGPKLVTEFADGLLEITCDARAVRQIVLQLLDNSAKFTETTGEIRLATSLVTDKCAIEIQVADTGSGMTLEQIEGLGNVFGHVGNAYVADSRRRGIGVGLAISRGLAELHGGTLKIESAPAHGTKVTVSLPLNGGVDAIAEPSPKSAAA